MFNLEVCLNWHLEQQTWPDLTRKCAVLELCCDGMHTILTKNNKLVLLLIMVKTMTHICILYSWGFEDHDCDFIISRRFPDNDPKFHIPSSSSSSSSLFLRYVLKHLEMICTLTGANSSALFAVGLFQDQQLRWPVPAGEMISQQLYPYNRPICLRHIKPPLQI